jgi:dTDP-4-amino-4,6-dideoxygalactose transaminase
MIATDNDEIAAFCKSYRVHGSPIKYVHDMIGINSRLDELQAIVLNIKLKHLQEYQRRRREIAGRYAEHFERAGLGSGVSGPVSEEKDVKKPGQTLYPTPHIHDRYYPHVFHQYVVRFEGFSREERDSLRDYLTSNGIGTSIYYPMGLHQQKCFEYLGVPTGSLPETEKACEETLALPIFPEMTDEEVEYIVEKIAEFVKNRV